MSEVLVLMDEIEDLKQVMVSTSEEMGMSHPETIKCSQELDCLINMYYGIHEAK